MLCEDVEFSVENERVVNLLHACDVGRASLCDPNRLLRSSVVALEPQSSTDSSARFRLVQEAASLLSSARRVLVTGITSITLESQRRASDIAECLGAAIDAGCLDTSIIAGPTIARIGEITASWEELRDRADLVVLWFCDPDSTHPRFFERFIDPPCPRGSRRVLWVGTKPPVATHRGENTFIFVSAENQIPMLQSLKAVLQQSPLEKDACCRVMLDEKSIEQLCEAFQAASCVAFVTEQASDSIGVLASERVKLVRLLSHKKSAFQIPLGAGIHAGGGNAAGAQALLTWRYGAPGAIEVADPFGSRSSPGESDAIRLISRREVDAVLLIGSPSESLSVALKHATSTLRVVHLCDAPRPTAFSPTLTIDSADSLLATSGTLLREDGTRVVLQAKFSSRHPTMELLLAELLAAINAINTLGPRTFRGTP